LQDRRNHLALLTRRAMLASALAEVAVHAIGTVAAEEAPRTVLRLQRRSIEVNAKSGLSIGRNTGGRLSRRGQVPGPRRE
jgi:hypothetical protein